MYLSFGSFCDKSGVRPSHICRTKRDYAILSYTIFLTNKEKCPKSIGNNRNVISVIIVVI